MKWTKEQQDAIEIRQKNILVSAAAGSGKTAVLVERIKQLILRDQIPLDQMLIVTFSNAAASEMREKIVEAISRELEEASETKKAAFLREQLNLIHRANISTFHAFSMEVIRRYFYLIDMEPNFKICDEAQKTILQGDAMEQLFSGLFESCSQDFIDFLKKFAITKNDNAVKDMIYVVHNFIQSIPDSFDWLRQRAEALCCSREDFENSPAFREIRGEISRNLALAEGCFTRAGALLSDHGLTGLTAKWKLDMDVMDGMKRALEVLPFGEFGGLISGVRFQTFAVSKGEKEAYEEIKEAVTALRDQGKDLLKKLKTQYFSRSLDSYVEDLNRTCGDARYLCYLVEEFDRIYKEKKRSKGLIDFSDIEHYALEVLSREEAAAEYRNKFAYIFIDEYQDSNIVQETLIGKIKRKNNLFMVGDVKQSIYKFRLAEPEIFISKYEAYKEGQGEYDVKLDLNRNFRSKGRVIAAVNDIFGQIMSKDLSGLDYDEAAALYPGRPYEGELDYPVELHLVDDMQLEDVDLDDEIREMKKAEMEASVAAQMIREAKGKLIFDAKRGEERPVTYKDIVILLRSARGYAEVYYEILMKEGIPAFVDASDGYFDTLEVEVFLNLIRVIDNRKQDIPLLSVLRSPIFGFTLEELIRIRVSCREGSYFRAFQEYARGGEDAAGAGAGAGISGGTAAGRDAALDAELREKCEATLMRIDRWKKETALMPLEDFLWMLIRETGYYEYIGGIPGGSQRQANLRALVDKAVQFQSSQMKGLFSFINYIEAIKKRNVPMGQVKLLGENDDVVRIMTIHKSKGLEFPVVLVAGLGKRFNRDSDTFQVSLHKEIGLGLRFVDEENGCYKKTLLQTVIEQKKGRESLAEELRILYVAFTRAMDRLILLGTLKDVDAAMESYAIKGAGSFSGARSYLDFLIPALPGSSILCRQFNRKDISFRKEERSQERSSIRRLIRGEKPGETARGDQPRSEDGQLRAEQTGSGENTDLKREIERRLGYEYGHREALRLKSKFTVSELSRLSKAGEGEARGKTALAAGDTPPLSAASARERNRLPALDTPKFARGKSRFTGAERGTILHKVMEHLDFRSLARIWDGTAGDHSAWDGTAGFGGGEETRAAEAAAKTAAVKAVVEDLVKREILTEEEAEAVSYQKIIGFFDSGIGRRALGASELYKEVSFNIRKELSGERIIIQGTIDCYFQEDGKYILLDYKSNYIGDGEDQQEIHEVAEGYRIQLGLYKEALEKIRGIRVAETYLYLFSLGRELRID